MSKTKITALIIAGIMLLYSLCAISLYLVITYFAPQKITEITVNAGALENVTDENEKWIINVEYYSNHANNGVEMLEVKFNYYMSDEELKSDNPAVYSKGVQIVGDKENSIQFDSVCNYSQVNFWGIIGKSYTYNTYFSKYATYCYDTQNGISFASVQKLDSNNMFQISIGENNTAENYLMKFLGKSNIKTDIYKFDIIGGSYDVYEYCDINYFMYKMLGVCRSNDVGYGADGKSTIDLGEIFAYKKMTNGAYGGEWLTNNSFMNDKLIQHFTNYFTIRIKTHENGATKASDSMFGMIEGKQEYEALGGAISDNYFHGEQTLTLTENDFDFLYTGYKKYLIVFKEETVEYIKTNAKNCRVNIVLNEAICNENGIYFDNSKTAIVFKNELYYSIANKIGKVYLERILSNGSISMLEVTI